MSGLRVLGHLGLGAKDFGVWDLGFIQGVGLRV